MNLVVRAVPEFPFGPISVPVFRTFQVFKQLCDGRLRNGRGILERAALGRNSPDPSRVPISAVVS